MLQFSTDDLKTPEGLERVLRQVQNALHSMTPVPVAQSITLPSAELLAAQIAPYIRSQLQAPSETPLNLTALLPTTGQATLIEDTHSNRSVLFPASSYPVGTLFYETDRGILYAVVSSSGTPVWQYVAGMFAGAFGSRPTDLGLNDVGFRLWVTVQNHILRWGGTGWSFMDGGGGYFADFAVGTPPSVLGWQICDGTATDYLVLSGADLALTAFTTPDETTANPGTYHKSAAAYSGTINAATNTGDTTATNQNTDLSPTTDKFTLDAGGTNAVTGFTNPHTHTQDTHHHAAGEPKNLEVIRYFRR